MFWWNFVLEYSIIILCVCVAICVMPCQNTRYWAVEKYDDLSRNEVVHFYLNISMSFKSLSTLTQRANEPEGEETMV